MNGRIDRATKGRGGAWEDRERLNVVEFAWVIDLARLFFIYCFHFIK